MDQVSIEYSFKTNGKFDRTERKTWSNRYSSFIDWQKCDSADFKENKPYNSNIWINPKNIPYTYYCNGKKFFKVSYNSFGGYYGFEWFDSNGNTWETSEPYFGKDDRGQLITWKNRFSWISKKCEIYDGYYSDETTTLYHQRNYTLNQYWAALVEIREFYKIVTPQF